VPPIVVEASNLATYVLPEVAAGKGNCPTREVSAVPVAPVGAVITEGYPAPYANDMGIPTPVKDAPVVLMKSTETRAPAAAPAKVVIAIWVSYPRATVIPPYKPKVVVVLIGMNTEKGTVLS
jgi:hypothetical protein